MLDARLLFDVHFQQGRRNKNQNQGEASAAEVDKREPHKHATEDWHSEQEQLASFDGAEKEKPP